MWLSVELRLFEKWKALPWISPRCDLKESFSAFGILPKLLVVVLCVCVSLRLLKLWWWWCKSWDIYLYVPSRLVCATTTTVQLPLKPHAQHSTPRAGCKFYGPLDVVGNKQYRLSHSLFSWVLSGISIICTWGNKGWAFVCATQLGCDASSHQFCWKDLV